MNIDKIVRFVAGVVVMVSVFLSHYVDERWLLLTSLVGLNLILSATVNWCPLEWMLKKCGRNNSCKQEKW